MARETSGKNQNIPQETQVLIVGGGPVGLSAAVEMGRLGVRCVIVEPRQVLSQIVPRAKTTSIRTMEHFRRWGLADRIRQVAPLKVDWSQDVVFCTTLLGHEVTRFHNCFGLSPQRANMSAESGQQIAQPLVEEVLREAVSDMETCQLCLGWSLHTLEQDDHKVRATIVNQRGEQRQIEAAYVVGCDGARSVVRAKMGAYYEGSSDQRSNLGIVFKAPGLAERLPHGPAVQYWVLNPASPGLMGRMDMKDQWWAGINNVAAITNQVDPIVLIHRLIGAEIEVEVLGTDPWTARMLLANRYQNKRVFLAGDAAHLNPPWGGHGFNTGIGDAVNIGWKLTAMLNGWGGNNLLTSYEAERRPVAEQTIEEATTNMSVLAPELSNPQLDVEGVVGEQARSSAAKAIQAAKDREFHSLGLVLGYQYEASPVIVYDGTPSYQQGQDYEPNARPGGRLPHRWVANGTSLYDQLGNGLSLLRLRDDGDPTPLVEAATSRGVPLELVELRGEAIEECYGASLLLVRPDQHVAWRGTSITGPMAGAVIDQVRGV